MLKTRDMLAASSPPTLTPSRTIITGRSRCAAPPARPDFTRGGPTEDWLGRTDQTLAFYRRFRDEFEPGKPFWNTETADAACGGNPWATRSLTPSATSTIPPMGVLIPTRADHHALAQSRRPMDMMSQGWSMRRFHASQQ